MNKVLLVGNLARDIEYKTTAKGMGIINNCVAVKRPIKENGVYETDFINIVCFSLQADYLNKYAHKGDKVEIVGRWQVRKYQSNNDTTITANECVVENISIISVKEQESNQQIVRDEINVADTFDDIPDDDLPF